MEERKPQLYITGDCHGEYHRFATRAFPEQKQLTKDDIVLICGDFGLWRDDPEERSWLKFLDSKRFTTVFIDGNHENFDRLYSNEFETVDFHGGRAHKIRGSVFHLLRGYVYDFCGKSFFCMGGASSHDVQDGILDPADYPDARQFSALCRRMEREGKYFRVKHRSWWPEEIPSEEELSFGRKTLAGRNFCVDYMVTHCLPEQLCREENLHGGDRLTAYFDSLLQDGLQFKEWHCGHYHIEKCLHERYFIHYEKIIRLL